MHSHVMRSVRLTLPLCAGMTFGVIPAFLWAEEIVPASQVQRLSADDFQERMAAEAALRAWTAKQPQGGKRWLLEQMRKAGEPEARLRLRKILRDRLAEEAIAGAPGYVGIRMNEVPAVLPGEKLARPAVQVDHLVAGAPAELAGLQVGDLIVKIDGKDFGDGPAVTVFSATVAGKKAGTKIAIEVLRGGKLETVPVVLGGRPLSFQALAPALFPGANGPPVNPEAEEEAARERLLKDWLKKQPPLAVP